MIGEKCRTRRRQGYGGQARRRVRRSHEGRSRKAGFQAIPMILDLVNLYIQDLIF